MQLTCEVCKKEKRHNGFPIVAGEGKRRLICRTCRMARGPAPKRKRCSLCQKEKAIRYFPARGGRPWGHSRCYACQRRAATTKYHSSSGVRMTMREWHLKKRYGLSLADYKLLLQQQNGGCGACGGPPIKSGGKHYHVDHSHTTGKVRGLLCGHCNHILGMASDDVEKLKQLVGYLERSR